MNIKQYFGVKTKVFLFVLSAVLANLMVFWLGAAFAPLIAFLFIGANFFLRDALHETFGEKNLMWKMLCLSVITGWVSFLINPSVYMIALASTVAFVSSTLSDTVVYQVLKNKAWLMKVNASNVVSSAIDTVVFMFIAFGGAPLYLLLLQFCTKLLGGAAWSIILKGLK